MEIQTRHDIFEPGDLTALVCIDEPEIQKVVVDQLGSLDYKLHTGLFTEDITLKLRTHVYDVVIMYENFNGSDIETNPVLPVAVGMPANQRRNQFLVLIGPNMVTNNEMQAFISSVDLVFAISDVGNLKPVLRRGVMRHKEFYTPFNAALRIREAA